MYYSKRYDEIKKKYHALNGECATLVSKSDYEYVLNLIKQIKICLRVSVICLRSLN